MRKYLLQISVYLCFSIIATPVLFIGVLQITDYNPSEEEIIQNSGSPDTLIVDHQYTLLTWNIGYAGLGNDMDFFYDGGEKVRTSLARTRQNIDSIKTWLKSNYADFVVLQEVDMNSKRTYYMNQMDRILREFPETIHSDFAYNYKVRYLPFPPTKPLGRIESGLLSFSQYQPVESKRISYLAKYSWPKRLWMLDRAFLIQKFETNKGKPLYIINTHNTAFDDGSIRQKETVQIAEYAKQLYKNGAFVLIAGDWNQTPIENTNTNENEILDVPVFGLNKEAFPSDWKIEFDQTYPTNRSLNTSQQKFWKTYIIDFVVCSPNVDVFMTKTQSLGFSFSDHNPVKYCFKLLQ